MRATAHPLRAALLPTLLWTLASGAGAQSITVAPADSGVTAVPVDSPWALLALGLALGFCAWRIFRQDQHRALFMALWGTALVVGMLWQSPELRAQIVNSFTHPAGETQPILVVPLMNGADIQGFSAVDFTNAAGRPMQVTAIQPPSFTQCFPGGAGSLQPAGAPDPSPPAACAVGLTLPQNAVCRVDVESICRALAAANTATLTVTPASLSFAPHATGTATVTNTGGTVAAVNVVATIPGGSNLTVQSTTCGGALAPLASCTITLTAAIAEGPTSVGIQGSNTNTAALSVSVSAAGPTASALSPMFGPVPGGTSVTVTGTGFQLGSTSVAIGGTVIPAGSIIVNSTTSLTFNTPAYVAGNVAVTVTTPDGTSGAVPGGFTYVP